MAPPNNKTVWFPAKKYGWGWSAPCRWQGWLTLLGFIVCVSVWSSVFNPIDSTLLFIVGLLLLTACLIVVYFIKGEKAQWRWGNHGMDNNEQGNAQQPTE